jgi:hypothetical protein
VSFIRAFVKARSLIAPGTAELLDRARALERRVAELEAVVVERDRLREQLGHIERSYQAAPQLVPPGHFYSAIPLLAEVERAAPRLYDVPWRQPPGVDLREEAQLALLEEFRPMYPDASFPEDAHPDWRYHWRNPAFPYSDAFSLHAMIRHVKPRRITEIGSGYSSCVTLDTNERWFEDRIECTFVEPYPQLLERLIRPGDRQRIRFIKSPVQDVPLETFLDLSPNDILFIDSTHVVRAASDVNHLFFEVLPRLADGVYVHVHDVFFPFEYPMPWLREGRQWDELYLLRAFLMYNRAFEVVFMNTFLEHHHPQRIQRDFPLCMQSRGGSIWLRKVGAG